MNRKVVTPMLHQLLNEKEQRFFEYMQGGQLPDDNGEALQFQILATQILKSFEDCCNFYNVTYTEYMVLPTSGADYLLRGRVWSV